MSIEFFKELIGSSMLSVAVLAFVFGYNKPKWRNYKLSTFDQFLLVLITLALLLATIGIIGYLILIN